MAKAKSTTTAKSNQRPDIVQWYDKSVDRWLKIERVTGEVISQKVTAGEYKNIHIAKRRPSTTRVVKKSAKTGKVDRKTATAAVKAVKKKVATKKKVASKKKVARVAKPKPPKKPRKVNYLNNKDLMAEVKKSKEQDPPQMTDKLAHMLMTLCDRYGRKSNWVGYSYNDDMRAFAMMMLVRTWKAFNPEKSNNPFAFFTQCIKNSFIQFLNQERRQRDIRDELYVDLGLDASYTYQEKYAADMAEQREQRSKSSDDIIIDTTSSDSPASGDQ